MPARYKKQRVQHTARPSGSGHSTSTAPGPPRVHHGMSSPAFHLSNLAYTKLIFHAFKYHHQTVNGVLIGSLSASGTVEIVDAVPLQHHWTNLSPAMEIGLGMVRSAAIPLPCFPSLMLSLFPDFFLGGNIGHGPCKPSPASCSWLLPSARTRR